MQAEAALAACTEALWTAIKQPARQRPAAEEWFAGPHADRLKAIQELALQRASPADTALAMETLQVILDFTPQHNIRLPLCFRSAVCLTEDVKCPKKPHCMPMILL